VSQYSVSREKPRPQRRTRVVVMAILYTAFALACGAVFGIAVYQIVTADSGFIVMLVLSGIFLLVMGYWSIHYLRDLGADPIAIEGELLRKWHKGNLFIFFFPSYYLLVEGKIFAVPREDYAMLLEEDRVRITCFPHSLTVEQVERYDTHEKRFIPARSGAD